MKSENFRIFRERTKCENKAKWSRKENFRKKCKISFCWKPWFPRIVDSLAQQLRVFACNDFFARNFASI